MILTVTPAATEPYDAENGRKTERGFRGWRNADCRGSVNNPIPIRVPPRHIREIRVPSFDVPFSNPHPDFMRDSFSLYPFLKQLPDY
jgi:hypothetical protein